jgi:hypothetical protein
MSRPDDDIAASGDAMTLAGLAGEVEKLYRDMRELRGLSRRVDDLAASLARMAETVITARQPDAVAPTPCWLDHETDPGRDAATSRAARDAEQLLGTLGPWVGAVYLRYSDAVSSFPDCWMWHPDVVEELLWLHRAWLSAYDPDAPVTAVGDWHDRQRPGVVARIRAYAGMCSLDAHPPGQDRATPAPTTPAAAAAGAVAAWWATTRDQPGPTPTAEQIATANARWRRSSESNHR